MTRCRHAVQLGNMFAFSWLSLHLQRGVHTIASILRALFAWISLEQTPGELVILDQQEDLLRPIALEVGFSFARGTPFDQNEPFS
jgi:hypothetical protein